MKTLTVFTCTYNRAHTIGRTYESLCRQTCDDFVWLVIDDGSTDGTRELIQGFISEGKIEIRYAYKENGGLFTGYNKAIELMDTELCVAIDSDDYMPDDAVGNIIAFWNEHGDDAHAGIIGLDYYMSGKPIGGEFPEHVRETFITHMNRWHHGDVKMVHRVQLLKEVAPMTGYQGEKFANPIYLFLKVDLKLPMLVTNQNFCFVEYQENDDSMSKNIFYQYVQSPWSFRRLRLIVMGNKRCPYAYRLRNTVHYVSSCLLCGDKNWLRDSPMKLATLAVAPLGALLYLVIKHKTASRKSSYK